MKTIVLYCLLAMPAIPLHAQIRKIPGTATGSFQNKYPSATEVSWRDNLTSFRASFRQDGLQGEARFNNHGEWEGTDIHYTMERLPGAVRDGFKKSRYTDWQVKEITALQQKDKEDSYRVLVQKSGVQKKYLFFNREGQLQRESLTL